MRRFDSCIFCAILRRSPTMRIDSSSCRSANAGTSGRAGCGAVGARVGGVLSRSACRMRPPAPLGVTRCRSMPSSQARRRTAGEAIGLSLSISLSPSPLLMSLSRAGPATGVGGLAAGATAGAAAGAMGAGAAFAGGSPLASPAPATSKRISSEPTAITSPTSPPSASTLPTTGDGISTVALSVITSASTWSSATTSPTLTCQATSSTSAMPSPRSGILMTCVLIGAPYGSIARRYAAATRSGPGK